jgi:hypothetical protein
VSRGVLDGFLVLLFLCLWYLVLNAMSDQE